MRKIFFVGFLFVILFIAGCKNGITGNAVSQISDNEYVKIPLSDLSATIKFYTYESDGASIKYFAVLGSDGKPRTAFNACDVCGGYQGYRQAGDSIKCNKCGKTFSIDGLGTENKEYGCWPSYLPHTVDENNLLIKVNDLKSGRNKFV